MGFRFIQQHQIKGRNIAESSYGQELFVDPTLSSASTIEVQSGGGTVEKKTDTPPKGLGSYIRCTAGDTSYERIELATDISNFVVGKKYEVRALVRTQTVSGSDQGFSTDPTFAPSAVGFAYVDQSITDWQWISFIYTAENASGTPRIYVNRASGNASDALDIAYLSVKEVKVA